MSDTGDWCPPQQLPHGLRQQSAVPAGPAAGPTQLWRRQCGVLPQQRAAATTAAAAAAAHGAAEPRHDGGQQSGWWLPLPVIQVDPSTRKKTFDAQRMRGAFNCLLCVRVEHIFCEAP